MLRSVSLALMLLVILLVASRGLAQETSVPADIQAALVAKLASYDRNFAARAKGTARLVLLVKKGSGKSKLAADSFKGALSKVDRIGGLPHEEQTLIYENAAAVVKLCQAQHIAIVYVTPGLESEIAVLREALAGTSVLSVSPVEAHVEMGIVLGFAIVSGRPKLVLNLRQARRQKVDFRADVLKLMKVQQ